MRKAPAWGRHAAAGLTTRRVLTLVAALTAVVATATMVGDRGASSTAATAAASPPSGSAPAGPASPTGTALHTSPSLRGQVTAIDGDRWRVSSTGGATTTVIVSEQTTYGSAGLPLDRARFTLGTQVAVTGARSGDVITAQRVTVAATYAGAPTSPLRTTAPGPPPSPSAVPSPVSVVSTCALNAELTQATVYAASRGERAAVAVQDTTTGTYAAAGDADAQYSSASVVKVLVATDLLLTGQMGGAIATSARQMITASDDDAADALYGLVGGDSLINAIGTHYGVPNLGAPPADAGQWGETKITANGLVHLYTKLKADPKVWPWLSDAMRSTTRRGSDGTDQLFGIPAATPDWAVKQGWMTGLGPGSTYNSTGFVNGDRYAVVLLTAGSVTQYGTYMADTISAMAGAMMPNGTVGGPIVGCPTP